MFFLFVLLSVVLNIFIGFVWYSDSLFGSLWAKDVGLKPVHRTKNARNRAIVVTALSYTVMALTIGYAADMFVVKQVHVFLYLVASAWFALVLCIRVVHATCEQRSVRYIVVTSAHDLISILVTAGIMYYA